MALWQDVIKTAENQCAILLDEELEVYLISLLMRYIDKPEVTKQIFAETFIEAIHQQEMQRKLTMQNVGDQCLLFAGLFPLNAEKRHVNLKYFVEIGRSAYATISKTSEDLFWTLSFQFVPLMDVLQSIRQTPDLLPLQAYEQWNDLGSKRAFNILQSYSQGLPLHTHKR